jgi:hypothetical protein
VVGAETAPALEALPQPLPYPSLASYSVSLKSGKIDWPQAVRCAIISGSLSAMVMVVPAISLFGMLVGGGFCVVLYRWRTGRRDLTPGLGMQLGAVSGLIVFLLVSILTGIEWASPTSRAEVQTQVVDKFQQQASRWPHPEADEILKSLKTPDGFKVFLELCLTALFVLSVLLCGTGGAIGAALLRKKDGP